MLVLVQVSVSEQDFDEAGARAMEAVHACLRPAARTLRKFSQATQRLLDPWGRADGHAEERI